MAVKDTTNLALRLNRFKPFPENMILMNVQNAAEPGFISAVYGPKTIEYQKYKKMFENNWTAFSESMKAKGVSVQFNESCNTFVVDFNRATATG